MKYKQLKVINDMNTQTTSKSVSKQTKTIKYRKVLNDLYKKGSISEKKYKKELKWIRDHK